jgi:hypothetical protein
VYPGEFRGKNTIAGGRRQVFDCIPFGGELNARKIDGNLEKTLRGGADLPVGMSLCRSGAKDAQKKSRDNQTRDKAFHFYMAIPPL